MLTHRQTDVKSADESSAAANNPPRAGIERYLNEVVAGVQAPPQWEKSRLLRQAADLLRAAKLKPGEFRIFQ